MKFVEDPCNLPITRGSGQGQLQRWAFNPMTKQCESFIYTGLAGKQNFKPNRIPNEKLFTRIEFRIPNRIQNCFSRPVFSYFLSLFVFFSNKFGIPDFMHEHWGGGNWGNTTEMAKTMLGVSLPKITIPHKKGQPHHF